jgi:hypothetical protein
LSIRSMTVDEKRALLQGLGTKQLVDDIKKAEAQLATSLRDQAQLRIEQAQFIKSARSNICEAVNLLESKLQMEVPNELNGKKLTAPDKEAWLTRQKTENKELAEAYQKQKMTDVVLADLDIKQKMAEIQLNDLRGILSLRVAQITLFAGDARIQINDNEEQITEEAKK